MEPIEGGVRNACADVVHVHELHISYVSRCYFTTLVSYPKPIETKLSCLLFKDPFRTAQ
jgi:hypothetical protein